jgi:hypothetical protein
VQGNPPSTLAFNASENNLSLPDAAEGGTDDPTWSTSACMAVFSAKW